MTPTLLSVICDGGHLTSVPLHHLCNWLLWHCTSSSFSLCLPWAAVSRATLRSSLALFRQTRLVPGPDHPPCAVRIPSKFSATHIIFSSHDVPPCPSHGGSGHPPLCPGTVPALCAPRVRLQPRPAGTGKGALALHGTLDWTEAWLAVKKGHFISRTKSTSAFECTQQRVGRTEVALGTKVPLDPQT